MTPLPLLSLGILVRPDDNRRRHRLTAGFPPYGGGALRPGRGWSDWPADTQPAEAAMPNHLSIEILGILKGSADGSTAVAVLGLMALALLIRVLCGSPDRGD
jgi:hypothetical protein